MIGRFFVFNDTAPTEIYALALHDAVLISMRLRMYKSTEELALIREGARICDLGGAAVVETLREGMPEYEVAIHATQAMVREIARTYPHTELMDSWTWVQSGINTDGAHNPLTTRRILPGDILSLNTFAMISEIGRASCRERV